MKAISTFGIMAALALLTACSSTTNVYDYYLKNEVETHKSGEIAASKSKLLLRLQESPNKAQVELVAFKTNDIKYLVFGSHKVAKAFYINDSLYNFDVTDLYSRVRGDDFIRQMGDLSVFFTHIPAANIEAFLVAWPNVQSQYTTQIPKDKETIYVDYALAGDVILSFEKNSATQKLTECTVWIGKRKHYISSANLLKAFNDFKTFN